MIINKLLIPIIILILTFQLTSAMGYGFSEESLLLVVVEPGLTKTFGYSIIPTSKNVMNYSISTEGELKKYLTVDPPSNILNIKPDENPPLTATLSFPNPLPPEITPGLHEVFINVVEDTGTGGMFNVRSGARIKIKILSLYDGTYLSEPKISIPNVNEGEEIKADITISNYGREKIKSAYAKTDLYDNDNNLQTSLVTESTSIDSQETKTISGKTANNLKSGDYKARTTIFWDEKTTTAETTLKIGSLKVEINDFTKEFNKDSIEEVKISIQSFWNSQLSNVYSTFEVADKKTQTPSITLNPWQTMTLTGYLNTNGLTIGEHTATIKVYYDNNEIASKQAKIVIKETAETENKTTEQTTGNSYAMIMAIVAIAIILIGFNIFWITKKKKR
ncbi:MAG: hypothetical protein KJ583_00985 [Nanoarchaeota archaeon]|nr:hypothetical protein [Nanoarchaeota archaeon]MBU1270487.1 hypothetical protein [Nanoarchaeota archaeon]MBU1603865.1 hypothetical protein [Nanoarchaeota archaeon]